MNDLGPLRHLQAVAQHGSLTGAARALGVSQPALTKSMQRLERDLRIEVLDRSRRPARLTPAGQHLARRADAVLDQLAEVARDADRLRGRETAVVRLGVGPVAAELLLPAALVRTLQASPPIQVSVLQGSWRTMTPLLVKGEIDAYVGDVTNALAEASLEARAFSRGPLVAFSRSGHPLCRRATVSAADLLEYPLVSATPPAWGSRWIQGLYRRAGRPVPRADDLFRVVVDSLAALRELVAASDAVSFAPPAAVAAEVSRGRLAVLPFETGDVSTHAGLVLPSGRPRSPALDVVIAALDAVVAGRAD